MDTVSAGACPANPSCANNRGTSRRTILSAAAVLSLAATTGRATAKMAAGVNPKWGSLVANYHQTRASWVETCDFEDRTADRFLEACKGLPPKPKRPEPILPGDILDMSLRQIRAAGDDPSHDAAWAAYERDEAAWTAERDALRDKILGPERAQDEANYAAYSAAFNALSTHRVSTLGQLCEKIEIVLADYHHEDIPADYLADILADVRHLAGEA